MEMIVIRYMRSRFEQIQIDITTTHSEIHSHNRWCFLYLPHRRLLALPLCLKVARGHHPFRGSFSLLNGNLNLSELQGFMKSLESLRMWAVTWLGSANHQPCRVFRKNCISGSKYIIIYQIICHNTDESLNKTGR